MDGEMAVGGSSAPQPVQGSGKTAPSKKVAQQPPHQKSTLSKSDQENAHKEPSMAAPMLIPPTVSINDVGHFLTIAGAAVQAGHAKPIHSDDAVTSVQIQMLQITNNALGKWVESLQEISAQNAQAHAQKRTEEIKSQKRIDDKKDLEENRDKARAAGEQSLIFSGLLVTGLVPGISAISASTLAPITQAVAALAPAGIQALPAAFVSLVGTIASGVVTQASLQTIFSGAKGKKQVDAEFVKNYSAKILGTINDPSFEKTLSKLFPEDADLIPQAKLILLSTALGLSYKAETGHITGQEFLALVNGTMKLPEGDPRLGLIAAFQSALADMKNGEEMKQKIAKYLDSNPSLDSLLEPSDTLAELFSGQGTIAPVSSA